MTVGLQVAYTAAFVAGSYSAGYVCPDRYTGILSNIIDKVSVAINYKG